MTVKSQLADLTATVESLNEAVRELITGGGGETTKLRAEITKLQKDLVELQISKDRIQENRAKEMREIEHKVGLENTRQEQELKLAKREVKIEVKEDNLKHEREAFESRMSFQQVRMEAEVDRVERVLNEVLKRLPDVSASLEVGQGRR